MEIKDTVVLNGPMLVHVEDKFIKLHSSNTKSFTIELIDEEVHPIEQIIDNTKEGIEVNVSSGVLDVLDYQGTYDLLNKKFFEEFCHKLRLGKI